MIELTEKQRLQGPVSGGNAWRLVIHLIIALLTFYAGVSACKVWDRRQEITDALIELVENYQD